MMNLYLFTRHSANKSELHDQNFLAIWQTMFLWSWSKPLDSALYRQTWPTAPRHSCLERVTSYRHKNVLGMHFPCPKCLPTTSTHCVSRYGDPAMPHSLDAYPRPSRSVSRTALVPCRGKKYKMKFTSPNRPTSANCIQWMNEYWRSYSDIHFSRYVCGFETPNLVGHASLCLPHFVLLGKHSLVHVRHSIWH